MRAGGSVVTVLGSGEGLSEGLNMHAHTMHIGS